MKVLITQTNPEKENQLCYSLLFSILSHFSILCILQIFLTEENNCYDI